jgi:hypothetical protein
VSEKYMARRFHTAENLKRGFSIDPVQTLMGFFCGQCYKFAWVCFMRVEARYIIRACFSQERMDYIPVMESAAIQEFRKLIENRGEIL